jgi:hypothetical protein
MQNLKTLVEELHRARRASAVGDPLLRVAARDAWRGFKDGKRKDHDQAGEANAYYRLLLLSQELPVRRG